MFVAFSDGMFFRVEFLGFRPRASTPGYIVCHLRRHKDENQTRVRTACGSGRVKYREQNVSKTYEAISRTSLISEISAIQIEPLLTCGLLTPIRYRGGF